MNIEQHFDGIQDYTVTLDVALDLERLKVPKMKATMYFKQPDKVHFKSEGFALLPREGIGFTPAILRKRFTVDSVRVVTGKPEVLLAMRPKAQQSRMRRAYAVVDSRHWIISRLTIQQFDGRSIVAEFIHQQVETRWLPSQTSISFAADSLQQSDPPDLIEKPPGAGRPSQAPRTGSVVVRYSDYRINTGLSDDVFEEKASD